MEREDLLNTLELASLALAKESESFLPILKGFRFDNGHVTAHDDILAVCLPIEIGVKGVLPGKQLLSFLSSCDTKEVSVEKIKSNVRLKCGRARLSLSVTPDKDWPFVFPDPDDDKSSVHEVGEDFFKAVEMCSSQVRDRGLASWLGGLNFYIGDSLRMYGVGAGRDVICSKEVKGISGSGKRTRRYIAPVAFCRAATDISKSLGYEATLHITRQYMLMTWKDETSILFTKLIDPDGPNVETTVNTILEGVKHFVPINDSLKSCLKRASLLGQDGVARLKVDKKRLWVNALSGGSELKDSVQLAGKHPDVEATVSVGTLLRLMEGCDEFTILDEQTVVHSKDGFHCLVANKNISYPQGE